MKEKKVPIYSYDEQRCFAVTEGRHGDSAAGINIDGGGHRHALDKIEYGFENKHGYSALLSEIEIEKVLKELGMEGYDWRQNTWHMSYNVDDLSEIDCVTISIIPTMADILKSF